MNKTLVVTMIMVSFLLLIPLVTIPSTEAAILGSWVPSLGSVRSTDAVNVKQQIIDAVAYLNAAANMFDGVLHAYSVNNRPNVEAQLFRASDALSASMVSLNAELTAVYPSLMKEQQDAIEAS